MSSNVVRPTRRPLLARWSCGDRFHPVCAVFVLCDRRPRLARQAFIFAFALGSVFSISRMMQGAHFFSHNVWTAIFCWLICLGSYYWVLYRPTVKAEAVVKAQPVSA
jgi:membrane-associated PAP2 superfamily phosphatase